MKSNEDNKTWISHILERNIFLCLKQVYCCLTFVCVYIISNFTLHFTYSWPDCKAIPAYWPDCKEIPAYGLMMSVCSSVCQHFGEPLRLSFGICFAIRPYCLQRFLVFNRTKFLFSFWHSLNHYKPISVVSFGNRIPGTNVMWVFIWTARFSSVTKRKRMVMFSVVCRLRMEVMLPLLHLLVSKTVTLSSGNCTTWCVNEYLILNYWNYIIETYTAKYLHICTSTQRILLQAKIVFNSVCCQLNQYLFDLHIRQIIPFTL